MLNELIKLSKECIEEMRNNCKMKLTKEDCKNYYSANECYICKSPFGTDKAHEKVRDHDHRTGQYRGAAHSCCNINYFCNRYLPVVFHNLRGYDSHLIIKQAWKITCGDINVIPNSSEKFMSINIGDLKFIDSFQFMASSLDRLANNLYDKNDKFKNFNFMKKEYPEHYEILCKKGFYPYEWVDSIKKINYMGLPH